MIGSKKNYNKQLKAALLELAHFHLIRNMTWLFYKRCATTTGYTINSITKNDAYMYLQSRENDSC